MALPTPTGAQINTAPALLKAIRDNGNEGHLGMTDDGELKVQAEITVGESIGIKAVLGSIVNVFGTPAAPSVLTGVAQAGATIETSGNQQYVFSFSYTRNTGSRVDFYFETSLDGTNWDRVQDEVPSGSVTTLSDGEFRKAVVSNARWSLGMNFRGAPYFRLQALGQGMGTDTLLVRAQPVSLS